MAFREKAKLWDLGFDCGRSHPPNPSELLLDSKFEVLITWLNQHYDYIVMDTPPVTLFADAFKLMRYTDANIYVMRQNYTHREIIKYLDNLRQNGQLVNGCIVLNDYQMEVAYGYGYGYYEEEVQVKKPFWKHLLP